MCSTSRLDCTSIAGRAYLGRNTHPASVAAEPICRPLCRGRKVEFVIGGAGRSADECLEAGVPPKLIGTRCRHCGRNTQIAYFAGHEIGQDQTAGAWTHDVHFDVCHRGAKRVRMKFQRLTHTAIVAVRQPHDDGRDASGSMAVEIDRLRSVCIY